MRITFNAAARNVTGAQYLLEVNGPCLLLVVKIFGEEYHRRADVVTISGLSSHAGQDLLTQYALSDKGQLKQIILVHGEPNASFAL